MSSHKTRRTFLTAMVVAGGLSFGLSTSAQTIYKCQLPNGQVEYTDVHCAGANSKVVHIRGDSKPLSNMTLVDLQRTKGTEVIKELPNAVLGRSRTAGYRADRGAV